MAGEEYNGRLIRGLDEVIKRISYDNYVIFQADFCWGD